VIAPIASSTTHLVRPLCGNRESRLRPTTPTTDLALAILRAMGGKLRRPPSSFANPVAWRQHL